MVLKGLQFLHAQKKIHRDIKADCILIESTETITFNGETFPLYYIRLSDFSSARSFNNKKKLTHRHTWGS